jgi:nicotinate dehydrogenase subunit A
MTMLRLHVNGKAREVPVDDPQMPLLYALRDVLGLRGPRFGCGLAQCGACTVHVDGAAVRSCLYPVGSVGDARVTTLEGLGSTAHPHKLQQAFIDEQAVQCGYCINGMIMQAKALLDQNPHPSDEEIKQALAANLCRCGTHLRIVRAIKRAAGSKS